MRARATPLTAVAQPVREMGRLLWERLSARIKGDASPAEHICLPGELKLRDSTAAPRARPPAEEILDRRRDSEQSDLMIRNAHKRRLWEV